jgi:hypothetical protein
MLKIILILYSLADIVLLTFLFKQYQILLKSEEYVSDSLMNKFIVGFLAFGGMLLVLGLLIASSYYIIFDV